MGRQRARHKKFRIDSIKRDCRTLYMSITQASLTAQDRNDWITTINRLPMHT